MTRTRAFAVALGAVAVATAIGFGLQALPPSAALWFLLFVPPILVAALVGGFLPALLATVLGALSAEYFFRRPYFTLRTLGEDIYPLALYLGIGIGIAVLAGRLARARGDVQRRQLEFETLFRLTPVGIGVATDPECRNIAVNPAFAEMLRIDTRDNASLSALDPRDRPPIVIRRDGVELAPEDLPLQMAARLGAEVKNVELEVVHPDGTTITLYEYAAPLFDDEGRVRGAVGAFLDITELKRAEDRLRRLAQENEHLYREAQEANRLKDEFLATLSHELRTPLNALLGWIQLLNSGQLSPEKRERALAAIERSAQLQAQLTSDLLDVSGVITGKLRLRFEPTMVPGIVDSVMEALRPAAESKGVVCAFRVDASRALLLDPARIQQILNNLVANAIKFTPRGGSIDVDVRIDEGDLVIKVSDTGVGISPAFLPFVFERFRQADSSTTRAFGGLGLGLSIVKQLAERHGGHVAAESAGENQGATFTVRIPARQARSAPEREEGAVASEK
ncbi:MAG: ATP-binding protein [Vicinamibacterales bacterium]